MYYDITRLLHISGWSTRCLLKKLRIVLCSETLDWVQPRIHLRMNRSLMSFYCMAVLGQESTFEQVHSKNQDCTFHNPIDLLLVSGNTTASKTSEVSLIDIITLEYLLISLPQ